MFSSLILLFAVGFSAAHAEVRTVPYVDLTRYAGTWYEIGSFPQGFQRGCKCVSANYRPLANGQIEVVNTCLKDGVDRSVTGRARVIDSETNAKLQVRFGIPIFLPTFSGNYWVIGLDPEYRYAVVSNRDGSSLWILSRTRQLEPALLDEALNVAKMNGLDLGDLVLGTQDGC